MQELRPILPSAPPAEVLEVHGLSYAFGHEVRKRQAFEQHCQWYAAAAAAHQADLEQMRREFNFFHWIRGGR